MRFNLQTIIPVIPLEDPTSTQQSPLPPQPPLLPTRSPLSSPASSRSRHPSKDLLPRVAVEAIEAWDSNIYIGTTNGTILHYRLEGQVSSESSMPETTFLQRRHLGHGKKTVERITVLPAVGKLVALCESTLSFYSLPDLEPLSSIPPVKGVVDFCVDKAPGETERVGERMAVVKRRVVQFITLSENLLVEREFALPDGAMTVCRYGPHLCLGDNQQYKLIDGTSSRLVPLLKLQQAGSGDRTLKPIVVVVGPGEFLVATATGSGASLGVFVNYAGDAIRGTLQWSSHPRSVGFQYPFIAALLRNNTIEIHNIADQQLLQSVQLSGTSDAKILSESPGFNMVVPALAEMLGGDGGRGVPVKLLVAGKDSVMALMMMPMAVEADSLLNANRVEEALVLAEQAERGLPNNMAEAPRIRRELSFVHQKAAFIYLGETLFDDAYHLFVRSRIDARALIGFFHEIRPSPDMDPSAYVTFDGIIPLVKTLGSIGDIVSKSLIKNYASNADGPPDAETATATTALRNVLILNAREMLIRYLLHLRSIRRRSRDGEFDLDEAIAIDTTLLRHYAESDPKAMHQLLSEAHECSLALSEQFLIELKRHYALSLLYKSRNNIPETLKIWVKICSGEYPSGTDDSISLLDIAKLVSELEDRAVVREYAEWVIQRDAIAGAKIFTLMDQKRLALFDPGDVLQLLEPAGADGVKTYLEFLILSKGNESSAWQTRLGLLYVDDLLSMLGTSDEERELKLQEQASSFVSYPEQSFATYLSTRASSDDLCAIRSRLLGYLGRPRATFSVPSVLKKIEMVKGLDSERVILYGKLSQHATALSLLVNQIHDYVGAEEYCMRLGRPELSKGKKGMAPVDPVTAIPRSRGRSNSVVEAEGTERRRLFLMLLKLYLELDDVDVMLKRVLKLLDTKASYLDVIEVLELLPDHWSIDMLERFLVQSMRLSIHACRESRVIKGLCRGENLMVSSQLIETHARIPPVILTAGDVCSTCGKRIGDSIFSRSADGKIGHMGCVS